MTTINFIDTTLDLARRGFHVLPLVVRNKMPIFPGGYKLGTTDLDQVRLWWTKNPQANIGIATGESNLLVMDNDHGLRDYDDFITWRDRNGLPPTYTVRSGRRPEFGVQMYYRGHVTTQGRKTWKLDGCNGDFKSDGGLVVHPPSIHPDTGLAYEVLLDLPIANRPDALLTLPTADGKEKSQANDDGLIECNRNDDMCSFIGKVRSQIAQLSEAACLDICFNRNDQYAKGPLSEDELTEIVRKQYRLYPDVGPGPLVTIGKTEAPKHWRERYATFEQFRDAKPTSFLIEGFLALDSITALAAPVGQRKSLIALNVAHSLCTGEPLFEYFKVVKQPERVVYLCPEMGISSFSTRLKQIGLLDHVGKNLFCQTMDDTSLKLSELDGELPGSVVILDTLTRFVAGDQNSAEDMSRFAQEVFRLKREGATVLLLHHSVKGNGSSNSLIMTLDSAMRGSTELAAFVTSCWATRLTDPNEPYQSPSLLVNVKQRDFESKPFETTCGPDCRMHIVGEPGQIKELKKQKDADAEKVLAALLKDNPDVGIQKLRGALADAGFKKGPKWITKARCDILGTGVTTSAA